MATPLLIVVEEKGRERPRGRGEEQVRLDLASGI
jgi:hypothetical protein